jgi:hypothetical protein
VSRQCPDAVQDAEIPPALEGQMNGQQHYQKAEQIPAELARTGGGSIEAEATLTLRAVAHAMLANAAATAIGVRGLEERAWMETAGTGHVSGSERTVRAGPARGHARPVRCAAFRSDAEREGLAFRCRWSRPPFALAAHGDDVGRGDVTQVDVRGG